MMKKTSLYFWKIEIGTLQGPSRCLDLFAAHPPEVSAGKCGRGHQVEVAEVSAGSNNKHKSSRWQGSPNKSAMPCGHMSRCLGESL